MRTSKLSSNLNDNEKVSILICVKNEAANLELNLPYILRQSYAEKELVIADDFSSDTTSEIANRIDNEEVDINLFKVKKNLPGKKQALKEAISSSRHSWLLVTDADCRPQSDRWIQYMMSPTYDDKETKIVLGYSPYRSNGSLLQQWIHFEAWLTGLFYLGMAQNGMPYMGVGRNMLYHKSLIDHNVFDKHKDLASGDDDLTIGSIANHCNTSICTHSDSFVWSDPAESFLSYWQQKRRHFATAPRYKNIHKFILAVFPLSQISFYFAIIICCLVFSWKTAIGFYALRHLVISSVVNARRKELKAEFSYFEFIGLDIVLTIYYVIFSVAVLFPIKDRWQ